MGFVPWGLRKLPFPDGALGYRLSLCLGFCALALKGSFSARVSLRAVLALCALGRLWFLALSWRPGVLSGSASGLWLKLLEGFPQGLGNGSHLGFLAFWLKVSAGFRLDSRIFEFVVSPGSGFADTGSRSRVQWLCALWSPGSSWFRPLRSARSGSSSRVGSASADFEVRARCLTLSFRRYLLISVRLCPAPALRFARVGLVRWVLPGSGFGLRLPLRLPDFSARDFRPLLPWLSRLGSRFARVSRALSALLPSLRGFHGSGSPRGFLALAARFQRLILCLGSRLFEARSVRLSHLGFQRPYLCSRPSLPMAQLFGLGAGVRAEGLSVCSRLTPRLSVGPDLWRLVFRLRLALGPIVDGLCCLGSQWILPRLVVRCIELWDPALGLVAQSRVGSQDRPPALCPALGPASESRFQGVSVPAQLSSARWPLLPRLGGWDLQVSGPCLGFQGLGSRSGALKAPGPAPEVRDSRGLGLFGSAPVSWLRVFAVLDSQSWLLALCPGPARLRLLASPAWPLQRPPRSSRLRVRLLSWLSGLSSRCPAWSWLCPGSRLGSSRPGSCGLIARGWPPAILPGLRCLWVQFSPDEPRIRGSWPGLGVLHLSPNDPVAPKGFTGVSL
ncbi:hypothetical protein OIU85_010138 [Salix viminalis]|uniref:Uncharacterized protein n=1 Tax=Salix viminalis TaxID=40686 RepID=A0A9Q0NW00_SALVM|nr:hypothetical protein OIU85_010138 [Salix viminalis]